MLKLLRLIFAFTVVLSTLACSELQDELEVFKDDVDFDANDRTMDIRIARAEPIAVEVIHTAYLAHVHLPLFNFLDENDLPEGAVLDGDEYSYACAISGQATYRFIRASIDEYRKGDFFSVSYEECMDSPGLTYSGTVTWKYKEIVGLNNRFSPIDTDTCVTRLDEEIDGSYTYIENIDDEGEYYPADSVRFIRVEDDLELQILQLAGNEENDEFVVVESQRLGSQTIIALREVVVDEDRDDEGVTRYKLAEGGVPSIDGDEVFTTKSTNWTKENCQAFNRQGRLSADQLSVTLEDGSVYRVHDSFSAAESSDDFLSLERKISSDSFAIDWTRASATDRYRFRDYEVASNVSVASGAYSLRTDGMMEHPDYGIAEIQSSEAMLAQGSFEPPYDGLISILGRNDESIDLVVFPFDFLLRVDIDGDNNGDGAPDDDAVAATFWQDLLNGVSVLVP